MDSLRALLLSHLDLQGETVALWAVARLVVGKGSICSLCIHPQQLVASSCFLELEGMFSSNTVAKGVKEVDYLRSGEFDPLPFKHYKSKECSNEYRKQDIPIVVHGHPENVSVFPMLQSSSIDLQHDEISNHKLCRVQ